MNGAVYKVQMNIVSASGDDPCKRLDVSVRSYTRFKHSHMKLMQASRSSDSLESQAEHTRQILSAGLATRRGLLVEAGVVEECSSRLGGVRRRRRRRYLLALWRGCVLFFNRGSEQITAPRMAPLIDQGRVDRGATVALGPSAVLALVEIVKQKATPPGILNIIERDLSPYPPQGLIVAGGGATLRHVVGNLSSVTSPLSALPSFTGSTHITSHVSVFRPHRLFVVDALVAVGNTADHVDFEAEFHEDEGGRTIGVGARPMLFRVRPLALLDSLVGSFGVPRTGVVSDSFSGAKFGSAPTMISRFTVGELLGEGGACAKPW
jgi:hypothetical protein